MNILQGLQVCVAVLIIVLRSLYKHNEYFTRTTRVTESSVYLLLVRKTKPSFHAEKKEEQMRAKLYAHRMYSTRTNRVCARAHVLIQTAAAAPLDTNNTLKLILGVFATQNTGFTE